MTADIIGATLWHGTPNDFETFASATIFLSTSRDFSQTHAGPSGRVLGWRVSGEARVFDSTSPAMISDLLLRTGPLHDPYDGSEYETAEAFLDALSGDTWEAIEAVLPHVAGMGYHAALITEGGVRNLAVFDHEILSPAPGACPEP